MEFKTKNSAYNLERVESKFVLTKLESKDPDKPRSIDPGYKVESENPAIFLGHLMMPHVNEDGEKRMFGTSQIDPEDAVDLHMFLSGLNN